MMLTCGYDLNVTNPVKAENAGLAEVGWVYFKVIPPKTVGIYAFEFAIAKYPNFELPSIQHWTY